MSGPQARALSRLLDVLALLPAEHLGMLAEAIIDCLDAAEDTDADGLDCEGCCEAEDRLDKSRAIPTTPSWAGMTNRASRTMTGRTRCRGSWAAHP